MTSPRPIPASPPVDFPVCGLDESWRGPRWLGMFGEAIGDPPDWVSLWHQGLNGTSLIVVETFSRPRTDSRVIRSGQPPLQHVALHAGVSLINVTLPVQSAAKPDGLMRALVEHVDNRSREYARWLLVSWNVHGVAAAARAWRFATGWAAVSDAIDGIYVAAVGVGVDPDGLSLTMVRDASAYHFDLADPLHPDVMEESAQAAGVRFDVEPPWKPADWHTDQLRLLDR